MEILFTEAAANSMKTLEGQPFNKAYIILTALTQTENVERSFHKFNIRKVIGHPSLEEKNTYILKLSPDLRMIIELKGDKEIIVKDIISKDRADSIKNYFRGTE